MKLVIYPLVITALMVGGGTANPPKSNPPVVVHPRLARFANPTSPARPAPHAVGKYHFFLKNPNFGFGLCGAAASAASASTHSRSTAASHVI